MAFFYEPKSELKLEDFVFMLFGIIRRSSVCAWDQLCLQITLCAGDGTTQLLHDLDDDLASMWGGLFSLVLAHLIRSSNSLSHPEPWPFFLDGALFEFVCFLEAALVEDYCFTLCLRGPKTVYRAGGRAGRTGSAFPPRLRQTVSVTGAGLGRLFGTRPPLAHAPRPAPGIVHGRG